MVLSLGCPATKPDPKVSSPTNETVSVESAKKDVPKEMPLFSKELKEHLYFAASLERESLRMISKNTSFERATLFSVLSYAFEIASGTKRSAPLGTDCNRFQIEKGLGHELRVLKTCQKPSALIALIQPKMQETEFHIVFKTKEWASVVGLSVTLTNPDIECDLEIKEKKLSSLSCENWAYFLSASDASATEIRLKTMRFHRNQELQLKLSGGFFRDLVERKKIDISVPLQGKIKLIEKEIEVKDDFVHQLKTKEDVHGEKENDPNQNKEKIESQGYEKSDEKKESDYQKWIQEGQQEQNQPQEAIGIPGQNPAQVPGQGGQPQEQTQSPQDLPNEVEQGETSGGVPKQPPNRGR